MDASVLIDSSFLIQQKILLSYNVDTLYIGSVWRRCNSIFGKKLVQNTFYWKFSTYWILIQINLCNVAATHALFAQNPFVICPVCGKKLTERYAGTIDCFDHSDMLRELFLLHLLTFFYQQKWTQVASTPMPEMYRKKMVSKQRLSAFIDLNCIFSKSGFQICLGVDPLQWLWGTIWSSIPYCGS